MKKRITACLLTICLLFGAVPVPVSAASYQSHFESSEEAMLDRYYGTKLDGLGEHAAVLEADAGDTYEADVDSALLIDTEDNKVLASLNAFGKVYPASTTKVLTALITLEECEMSEEVTIRHDITFDESGVVAVGLKKGDKIKVEGLLNALLVESANDAAVALAEHIAGSTKAFAGMMNQRARELGATNCNFVTTNGLHNKNHYVTAYDMYLIFKEAIRYDAFLNIVKKSSYTLEYETAAGVPYNIPMETTNHYITGDYALPSGVFMIGGKTGTTSQAGSCLVILTEDNEGREYISLVFHGVTRDSLYHTMTDLLEKIHK